MQYVTDSVANPTCAWCVRMPPHHARERREGRLAEASRWLPGSGARGFTTQLFESQPARAEEMSGTQAYMPPASSFSCCAVEVPVSWMLFSAISSRNRKTWRP